jgi:hypothetical protein
MRKSLTVWKLLDKVILCYHRSSGTRIQFDIQSYTIHFRCYKACFVSVIFLYYPYSVQYLITSLWVCLLTRLCFIEEAGVPEENHRPLGKQPVSFITCGCESSAPFLVIYKANPRCIGDKKIKNKNQWNTIIIYRWYDFQNWHLSNKTSCLQLQLLKMYLSHMVLKSDSLFFYHQYSVGSLCK